jgi:hypothetical protein
LICLSDVSFFLMYTVFFSVRCRHANPVLKPHFQAFYFTGAPKQPLLFVPIFVNSPFSFLITLYLTCSLLRSSSSPATSGIHKISEPIAKSASSPSSLPSHHPTRSSLLPQRGSLEIPSRRPGEILVPSIPPSLLPFLPHPPQHFLPAA